MCYPHSVNYPSHPVVFYYAFANQEPLTDLLRRPEKTNLPKCYDMDDGMLRLRMYSHVPFVMKLCVYTGLC